MKTVDIVRRLEDIRLYQGNDLGEYISKLQNELLGDPTGSALMALRQNRTADFWATDSRPEAPQHEKYWRGLANGMSAEESHKKAFGG